MTSRKTSSRGDRSIYVSQNKKIDWTFVLRELPWTAKQEQLIQLLLRKDVKCVFIKGPAGTSKSLTAVYVALKLLLEKKVSDIIYIRPAVESASHSLGHLPGDIDDKMGPYTVPFHDKLDELIDKGALAKLNSEKRLQTYAINFLRGTHLAVKAIIVDEAQSATFRDLVTTITRVGEFSKLIVCGDPKQSDLKNGSRHDFEKIIQIFDNPESQQQGIYTFEFTKEDIVRSEFVRFVVEQLEKSGYGEIV